MMIKLITTYQASSSSSHCAAQSPKLTRVTGSSPCFKTILVNTFLILFCFFCILFIILHLFHHGQTNQYLQIAFFIFFSLSFFLFIIIHLFHHDPTKNAFLSSSTLVSPPRQQRRPFCECFRSGFCFWSLSSLDEVAPHSGWCAFRLIVFTGSFLYLFPPFSVPRLRQDWLWPLKIS